MALPTLTEQQQNDAERLVEALRPEAEALLQRVARLLAANPGAKAFGSTEFLLRDLLLSAGATFLQTALAEKKTATRARPSLAPAVAAPPSSLATVPAKGSSVCSVLSACAAPTTIVDAAGRATAPSTSRPA
jgi:hypothetical protein